MTAKSHRDARLLFVISKDYGSLGWAMLFLEGQEFASRSLLVLPTQVHRLNLDALPVRTAPYATPDDVLAAVDAHAPDIVLLVSGYLLADEGIFSVASVDQLVRTLRERGCQVVTDDPLLGLASTPSQINRRLLLSGQPLLKRWGLRWRLWRSRHQPLARPALNELVHLHPTSATGDRRDGIRRVAFFNREVTRPPGREEPAGRPGEVRAAGDRPPSWLFVLSSTDLDVQHKVRRTGTIDQTIVRLLRQAVAMGARATVIGPAGLTDALRRVLSQEPQVELVSFCPYGEFVTRLIDAEYVFYWNVFSCSLLVRLANRRPVFFFDRGHLSHAVPAFYDVARPWHFGEWKPTFLEQDRPLDRMTLAGLADGQRPSMEALVRYWEASPTPAELVDQLLHAAPRSGPAGRD